MSVEERAIVVGHRERECMCVYIEGVACVCRRVFVRITQRLICCKKQNPLHTFYSDENAGGRSAVRPTDEQQAKNSLYEVLDMSLHASTEA